jgi:hypothetical protein
MPGVRFPARVKQHLQNFRLVKFAVIISYVGHFDLRWRVKK